MDRTLKFVDALKEAFTSYWDNIAIGDYMSGKRYTHKELCEEIIKTHILFKNCGVTEKSKIAIMGKNSCRWAITYLATITNGSIAVPVLEDFNPVDVSHILNHSESSILFCDSVLWDSIKNHDLESVKYVFALDDNLRLLYSIKGSELDDYEYEFSTRYPNGIVKSDLEFRYKDENEMVSLNYTSGTTSLTKGVMLTSKNLVSNVTYIPFEMTRRGVEIKRTICVLPMAHAYGLAFGFLGALLYGTEVIFLGRIPSPNLMLEACQTIKPELLVLVPLVFEKIYKYNVAPIFAKPLVKVIHEIGALDKLLHKIIVRKIAKTLGGELKEVIIGGAAFNSHIGKFLSKGGFPYTVGYGMTECGPLISYINPNDFVHNSVGKILLGDFMEIRISKQSQSDECGEIQVRGDNVMIGYYKDNDATAETFTEDGWLRTGDKGMIDSDGNIFIKGRYKTMLLGPSGENIYPEAIETKLSSLPLVGESYIVQNQRNKLDAYVYPDYVRMKSKGINNDMMIEIMKKNRLKLNRITANFENISSIYILEKPLPKTPKNTVKRYGLESHLSNSRKVQ